jgi:hypothetical protein
MRRPLRASLVLGFLAAGLAMAQLACGATTAQISAKGRKPAQIVFSPAAVSWGEIELAPAAPVVRDTTVVIRNAGQRTWTGTIGFVQPCAVFSLTGLSNQITLAGGASATITIRLTLGPQDTLQYVCQLRAP